MNTNAAILTVGLAAAVYIVLKKETSLFSSYDPTDPTNINSVWNATENNKPAYTYTIHASDANELSETIYNALSAFSTDFNTVFSAIKKCSTQGDVYQIAQLFMDNYDVSLWTSLINGFGLYPGSGISNSQAKQINDYVNSLPL